MVTTQGIEDPQGLQTPFRQRSLAERQEKLGRLLSKNPEKVPIIFERHPLSKLDPSCRDVKFLSTKNLKLAEFTKQLREMWMIEADKSLFFSCNGKAMLNPDLLVGDIYDKFRENDGYLYIRYREVESFGN